MVKLQKWGKLRFKFSCIFQYVPVTPFVPEIGCADLIQVIATLPRHPLLKILISLHQHHVATKVEKLKSLAKASAGDISSELRSQARKFWVHCIQSYGLFSKFVISFVKP